MTDSEEEKTSFSSTLVTFDITSSVATYDLKEQRKRIREWAKVNLVGKLVNLPALNCDVTFTSGGIKEAINQPHNKIYYKNEAIKDIITLLMTSTHVNTIPHADGDTNLVYHYFETVIGGEKSYIVLKETKHNKVVAFYTIVDKIKK